MRTLESSGGFLPATLVCLALLGGCSLQEDIVRLDMRLAALESTRAELKETVDRAEAENSELRTRLAETRAAMDALRAEVSRVRGGVEETQYALGEKLAKAGMDEDLARLETRVRQIEAYLDLQPSETQRPAAAEKSVPAAPDSPAAVPETPDAIYQAAKRNFDRGAYEAARNGFQQFLDRYPKDPNADNARFWLGETYYREQWYEKAILEYQEVIENYPDGNKVPASLLKQGLAFFNLGDKGNARLILKELIRKFPDSNEAKIARQKIEGMN